ncbi:MAG: hypothetical protein LBP90_00570 [Burkholderiales bacterium]|jgi:hypothetical protein|nr:hypothetical protein [Burkholderiales bacterium]
MFSSFFLKAHVFFLDETVGGRHGYASGSGIYRPLLKVDDNYQTSCCIVSESEADMETGQFYNVMIELLLWKQAENYLGVKLQDRLKKGKQIHIYEVDRIVAVGVVEEVIVK